ncbi:MAG: hypothetical protein QM820_53730 [Minicystis sp.]
MRRTIHALLGLVEIVVAALAAVERDEELVALAGLVEGLLHQLAPLIDGQAVVLDVADHVGPAKIPRLERGGDRQVVLQLGQGEEALRAGPAIEHGVVVGRDVLARPVGQRHGLRRAPAEDDRERRERAAGGPFEASG